MVKPMAEQPSRSASPIEAVTAWPHAWTGKGAPRRFDGYGMCFIEAGNGRAGIGKGNFYAEPTPQVEVRGPGLMWHAGKILYEKYWLYRRF